MLPDVDPETRLPARKDTNQEPAPLASHETDTPPIVATTVDSASRPDPLAFSRSRSRTKAGAATTTGGLSLPATEPVALAVGTGVAAPSATTSAEELALPRLVDILQPSDQPTFPADTTSASGPLPEDPGYTDDTGSGEVAGVDVQMLLAELTGASDSARKAVTTHSVNARGALERR